MFQRSNKVQTFSATYVTKWVIKAINVFFDKTLGHVKFRKCQTFGHYPSKCNARDGIKINILTF